ncbi:MAG: CHAP domain-containing protein [Patescibacteria group bacterium]
MIAAILGFVILSGGRDESTPTVLNLSAVDEQSSTSRPLDQLSSADIAVNLARLSRLEEVYWITEQAEDVKYLSEVVVAADPVAEKPQVVNDSVKTRADITTYVTIEGDTVNELATTFDTSSDSIKWSNGLTGNSLDAGEELFLPPEGLKGIVHKVAEGDTVESIANKYDLSKEKMLAFNDIIDDQLPGEGELLFLQDAERKIVRTASVSRSSVSRTPVTGTTVYGYSPLYSSNGYAYGHCTYYIATKAGAPNGLGNANTWDNRAERFGYTKSKTPVVGAIAQKDWGSRYGHVAYVEEVSADGTMFKYSDMNGIGGWNRVFYSDWVPVSSYNWFLY